MTKFEKIEAMRVPIENDGFYLLLIPVEDYHDVILCHEENTHKAWIFGADGLSSKNGVEAAKKEARRYIPRYWRDVAALDAATRERNRRVFGIEPSEGGTDLTFNTVFENLTNHGWVITDEAHGNIIPHYFEFTRNDSVITIACVSTKAGKPGKVYRMWVDGTQVM